MSFGSCCILDDSEYSSMETKSVHIKGEQCGLLINFELIQTFYHTESKPKEVCYLFPNDLKLCIYDTTFVVGKEIIKPKLEPKEEAEKTYEEAVKRGHTAVYGSNIENGLTEFKLGNVPANTDCKVILKIAFTANITNQNSFFLKFPLDVYTPSGSKDCLDVLSSNFLFQIQCDKEKIKSVKSNIKNGIYDDSQKTFSIQDRINCNDNEKSIIINFETNDPIQSSVYIGQSTNDYDNCAITIFPNLEEKRSDNPKEIIFVIDCSGSMEGTSIKKASECLEVFIRSLPVNTYFNVILFGSSYNQLFESSIQYNESSIEKALNLAKSLQANLGGTAIYEPLKNIFKQQNKFGQRQVFIMTDGEVNDIEQVLELVSENSKDNRCFTIGIGRFCDAGLVEGIANSSGGKCDFVQEGDSISEKVIPQLQSSLFGQIESIQVHVEENDEFQTSPFPLPSISPKGSCVVYLRTKNKNKNENKFDKNFLLTANYANENIDIPIVEVNHSQHYKEDEFGCSEGKNIGNAILPLFAFQLLQKYEKVYQISDEDRKNAIELSLSSGVLCKYTGYVGISGEKCSQIFCDVDIWTNGWKDDVPSYVYDECCCCYECAQSCDCESSDNYDCLYECAPAYDEEERAKERHELKSNENYDLMNLLRLQNFNGYWENLDELNNLLKSNINHINGVNIDNKEIEKNCVATLIAIAALNKNSYSERDIWIMIEQKAINWLKKILPDADIDALINEVKSLL